MSTTGTQMQMDDERNEWRERIENKIDKLIDRMNDDAQIRANVSFIFQPKGVWEQYALKVERHEAFQNQQRGAMGLLALLSLASLVTLGKSIIGYFKQP